MARGSVEETLNELLEAEAEKLTQAARYERSEARQRYRSGHYDQNLTTASRDVTLHVPRLKQISFEAAIIEGYYFPFNYLPKTAFQSFGVIRSKTILSRKVTARHTAKYK